jgi:surface antigen
VRSKTGTDAYTPTWANWYAAKGRWGTKPKVGAMVFYDWGGSKSRANIDHVGIVEKVNSDGSIVTIEGNHSNAVARVNRSSNIVGYGYWA